MNKKAVSVNSNSIYNEIFTRSLTEDRSGVRNNLLKNRSYTRHANKLIGTFVGHGSKLSAASLEVITKTSFKRTY